MNYDQLELDAAYDQSYYEPLDFQTYSRLGSDCDAMRARIGMPRQVAYGPTEIEKLDIYTTSRPKAPIFVFIHGGAWLGGSAKQFAYAAEMFVRTGGHCVVPDFTPVKDVGGDLEAMATQVRRAMPGFTRMRHPSTVIRNASISAAILLAGIFVVSLLSPIGRKTSPCPPRS
jgi:arylformamidase